MKYIFRTLIVLGVLLLWGTAGASDHNTIDGVQTVLQVSIAAFMMGVGYIGLKVLGKIAEEKSEKEERLRRSDCRKRSGRQKMSTATTYKLYTKRKDMSR